MTRRLLTLLVALCAAGTIAGQAAKKSNAKATITTRSAAGPTTRLVVPPIQYKTRTLGNGLQLYTVQDKASPTVAIHVWYKVGSKHDPEGRSGFAHLFEHIMFKGTKNMPDEMLDRLTEDVGGWNNATTRDDVTIYYEVVPSHYLETLLWAEGERLASLKVNDLTFRSERDVVKEEFRFRILAPSYGRLWYALEQSSFAVHPYKRPGIGSIEDLDAATTEDVIAFHRAHYRPDNAVMIVVGDFDEPQLNAWVDKYLGSVPRPAGPIPRVTVKEPARTAEKRVDVTAPNVPLPAIALTWLTPEAVHPDNAALAVANAILGTGESSRLNQSLVYRQQIAQTAETYIDFREDVGIMAALAIMASGKTPADGEKALRAELGALAEKPPSGEELEKAKNQIIAGILRERETNNGKALDLGQAIVIFRDANEVNRQIARLQAVTPADVQRVMKKYVADGKAVVVNYTAEKAAQGGQQ